MLAQDNIYSTELNRRERDAWLLGGCGCIIRCPFVTHLGRRLCTAELNLGRHSTYRRGKSVQTTGTTSLGPDGLSRFDELSRREVAQTAILHAFDLIEHDGEDLRNLPFLDRKAALARLLVSKSVDGTYRSGPCRVWIKVRNPASVAVQRERSEIWNRRASGSARRR